MISYLPDGYAPRAGVCTDGGSGGSDDDLLGVADVDTCLMECRLIDGCLEVEIEHDLVAAEFNCFFRTTVCDSGNIDDSATDSSLWAISSELV